jgi:hypothetical protein
MSSYVDLLNKTAQEINIIIGIILFTLGIVGNSLNILIFSSLLKTKIFPLSPVRLYLLTISISDLVFVGYLLLTRILISGFLIPLTNTNEMICKSRFYLGQVSMYTSLYTTCFATIDQYLISSRSVRIRQLSQISLTKLIIFISILIWCSINIPVLFLYKLYPKSNGLSTVCTVYSSVWTFYYTYFQSLLFLCIIPLTIFIIFSLLRRHNLRLVRQVDRSITRQMNRMVYFQSITMSISLLISTVQIIYQFLTMNIQKDSLRLAQDNIFNTAANLLTYVNYIAPFYIYLFSSKSLRKNFQNLLTNRQQIQSLDIRTNLSRNQCNKTANTNQIQPITIDNLPRNTI